MHFLKYSRESYGPIVVSYTSHLEGGGRDFGQALVGFVEDRIGPVESMLEWCCGPGFIGFAALARGLCRELALSDINEEAAIVCRMTASENQLQDRVAIFESDCFDCIPDDARWDVVVGNPPHRRVRNVEPRLGPSILYIDDGWKTHRKFYRQVSRHLKPGGSVVLIEGREWSEPAEFREMAEDNGLRWAGDFPAGDEFYMTWARRD
jgi:methylase of polypeptide subunit release factors